MLCFSSSYHGIAFDAYIPRMKGDAVCHALVKVFCVDFHLFGQARVWHGGLYGGGWDCSVGGCASEGYGGLKRVSIRGRGVSVALIGNHI